LIGLQFERACWSSRCCRRGDQHNQAAGTSAPAVAGHPGSRLRLPSSEIERDLERAAGAQRLADAAWAEVKPAMDVLNGVLGKTPWLLGSAFSIADLNVAGALWRGLSTDLSQWPAARDWLARCWDRPAARRARAMREG